MMYNIVMKKGLNNFPHKPGCYLYKDNSGLVIYVGKAKDLQKRIGQYFQKKDLDPKLSCWSIRLLM